MYREAAQDILLHGMPREELESIIHGVFTKADADKSGLLDFQEFYHCLQDAHIGLTRREINFLLTQADFNEDSLISYKEFLPICFRLLTEIMKEEIANEVKTPSNLEASFQLAFEAADPSKRGLLNTATIRTILRSCDVGLTRLQIHTIMAEARPAEDVDELIDYKAFAPMCAKLTAKLISPDVQQQRLDAISQMQGLATVHGYDVETVSNELYKACEARDPTRSGHIPRVALRHALAETPLGLTAKEVNALINAAEVDQNGNIDYPPLIDYSFTLLNHMAREEQLAGLCV